MVARISVVTDPLAGQRVPMIHPYNLTTGPFFPFPQVGMILDSTWQRYNLTMEYALAGVPDTAGDLEVEGSWGTYEVGQSIIAPPSAPILATVPEADLVNGIYRSAVLLEDQEVVPGAFCTLEPGGLARTGDAGDTLVLGAAQLFVFALTLQRTA